METHQDMNNDKSPIHVWAKEIATQQNFSDPKLIYQGGHYAKEDVRNVIYEGLYQGKLAVLKVYDDPRHSDEPISQKRYLEDNASVILTAPEVYAYEIVTPNKGWFIMEKLPESGSFFTTPLSENDRKEFLNIFVEYRKNFPRKATREILLVENLPAHEFCAFRIGRWLEFVTKQELKSIFKDEQPLLDRNVFIPLYAKAMEVLRLEFSKREMIWCHGHFKPQEIYKVSDDKYYVTDFAHTRLYPEGYEFGFIIWADYLMSADWSESYESWKRGVRVWFDALRPVADELGIARYDDLIRASMIERVLGTILADVHASDIPNKNKIHRIEYLQKLLRELINHEQ